MPRVLRSFLPVVFSSLLALAPASLRAQDADAPKGAAQSREESEKNFEKGESGDEGSFIRQRQQWFQDRRAYPLKHIPAGIRQRAINQRDAKLAAAAAARASTASPAPAAQPQWVQIGPQPVDNYYGVSAGRVTALAVDPENPKIVYAGGAEGGVWKTTDGGATWVPLTDGQPSLAVGSITLDPNNSSIVYVGTGEENFSGDSYYGAGVLKSTDGGATWTQICGPFCGPVYSDSYYGGGARIGQMSVQPGNSKVVLAAVEFSGFDGIYRSTNAGVAWTQVISGLGPGTAVFFDPANANVAYAATTSGVFKSADAGKTWSASNGGGSTALPNPNGGRVALALAPSSSMVLYAGIGDPSTGGLLGFYKSTTGGASWTQLANTPNYCGGQCWYDDTIGVSPVDPNFVIVGGSWAYSPGNSAALRSLDGGNTWTDFSAAIHPDAHAMAFANDGSVLYTGNDGGVWSTRTPSSTNINWISLNSTLALTEFYPGISMDPGNVNHTYAGTQDNGTNKYSGSVTWPTVACGDGGATAIDFAHPNVIYTGCITATLYKSTDDGVSFNDATNGIVTGDRVAWVPPLAMDPENSQTLYFGTYRVYQTTNAAGSWTPISGDLTSGGGTLSTLAAAPTDSNTVYSGSDDGRVYVTRNALSGSAAHWTNVTTSGLPNRTVDWIAVDPTTPTTAYVVYNGFSGFFGDKLGHVFKTTNAGGAWTDISSDLPNTPVNAILVDPDSPETLFIGTDIGAFYTSSGGASWSTLGTGLPNVVVVGLALHNGSRTLRAATHGRSVWDLNIASLGLTAPQITSLSPNYGAIAAPVTISGSNFGAAEGSGYVQVNGAKSQVIAWSSTAITVRVPYNGAPGAGSIVVTAADGDKSNPEPFTLNAFPTVTNVSVTTGVPGAPVTITGTNLLDSSGHPSVTFNGTPATIVSDTATSIHVTVPAGATSGRLDIEVNGVPLIALQDFIVTPSLPNITSISPNYGAIAADITISGNFDATQGNGYVTVGSGIAQVTAWSSSQITIRAPYNGSTGNIIVRQDGKTSNGVPFTLYPFPTITNVSASSGAVGSTVTITGTNLLDGGGKASVTFNGIPGTIVSDTAESIQVKVPLGATSGRVIMQVNNVALYALQRFTVE